MIEYTIHTRIHEKKGNNLQHCVSLDDKSKLRINISFTATQQFTSEILTWMRNELTYLYSCELAFLYPETYVQTALFSLIMKSRKVIFNHIKE